MNNEHSLHRMFDPDQRKTPLICVEMSGNHQGSKSAALEFVRLAKASGADLLKLQVYRPDTITLKSERADFRLSTNDDWARYGTLYDLYEKAHTPWDWVESIFFECRTLGLAVWASPFDPTAVAFLEDLGCPYYKIASPEITDLNLIETCARTGKPVVISTGLAEQDDLDAAVSVVRQFNAPLMILKCVSAYPTPVNAMNLATIPWLKQKYGCAVGLSDHTLGPEAAYAAAALGATMIEKHFRMPGDETSIDASFSMSLDELPVLKSTLADIHAAIGTATLDIPDIAKPSLTGRRSLYVVADINAGEIITETNVRSIRPHHGLPPKYLSSVLGKRAKRDASAGERLSWDIIEHEEKK